MSAFWCRSFVCSSKCLRKCDSFLKFLLHVIHLNGLQSVRFWWVVSTCLDPKGKKDLSSFHHFLILSRKFRRYCYLNNWYNEDIKGVVDQHWFQSLCDLMNYYVLLIFRAYHDSLHRHGGGSVTKFGIMSDGYLITQNIKTLKLLQVNGSSKAQ